MKDMTEGKLQEQLEFAKTLNQGKPEMSLQDCIDQLNMNVEQYNRNRPIEDHMKLEIYKDFAPRSFYFCKSIKGIFSGNGGIIFHGAHDNGGSGAAPTFSVSLNPDTRSHWELHT